MKIPQRQRQKCFKYIETSITRKVLIDIKNDKVISLAIQHLGKSILEIDLIIGNQIPNKATGNNEIKSESGNKFKTMNN